MNTIAFGIVGAKNVGKQTFIQTIAEEMGVAEDQVTLIDGTGALMGGFVANGLEILLISCDLHVFSAERNPITSDTVYQDLGFCILVDSTNTQSFNEAWALIQLLTPIRPYFIVANKQDREDAMTVGQIRREMKLPAETIILPCVATERASVANVLNTLLTMIRPDIEERIT